MRGVELADGLGQRGHERHAALADLWGLVSSCGLICWPLARNRAGGRWATTDQLEGLRAQRPDEVAGLVGHRHDAVRGALRHDRLG